VAVFEFSDFGLSDGGHHRIRIIKHVKSHKRSFLRMERN
jgi:hypothetical protein